MRQVQRHNEKSAGAADQHAVAVAVQSGEDQMIACGEIEATRRLRSDRLPSLMVGDRSSNDACPQSGRPGTQTEIDLFKSEEVTLVEESHPIEHVSPHEHEATAYSIDVTVA